MPHRVPGVVVVVVVVVPVWDVCACVCVCVVCIVVVIVWVIVCVRNVWRVRRRVWVVVRVVVWVVVWVVIWVMIFISVVVVILSAPLLFGVVVCVCDRCHVHFDIVSWVHVRRRTGVVCSFGNVTVDEDVWYPVCMTDSFEVVRNG